MNRPFLFFRCECFHQPKSKQGTGTLARKYPSLWRRSAWPRQSGMVAHLRPSTRTGALGMLAHLR